MLSFFLIILNMCEQLALFQHTREKKIHRKKTREEREKRRKKLKALRKQSQIRRTCIEMKDEGIIIRRRFR